jgi:hypothetical protein
MKLPNYKDAYIPVEKLRDYLLSESHPEGGPKAAFFELIGYSKVRVVELEAALLSIAYTEEVTTHFQFTFGNKYIIDGSLPRKSGTDIPFRTVWVINSDETAPRFVTGYPL